MKCKQLPAIRLDLFDGGTAAAGEAAGAAAPAQTQTSTKGETKTDSGTTRRGKSGEFQGVLFGQQHGQDTPAPQAEQTRDKPPVAGVVQPEQTPPDKQEMVSPKERRRAYQELVNGEYKDIHTQETQRIIDQRFKQVQGLEEQVARNQPVIDLLMQRYQISDGDMSKLGTALENDDTYWREAADEAGMDVAQYKQFQRLQRENAALLDAQRRRQGEQASQQQMEKWYTQAAQAQTVYPDFDLAAQSKNPQFVAMLRAGVPVQHAYEVLHMEQIKTGVAQNTAKQTEKQVVDGIRAKGARPVENGTSSQSAFTVKDDASKLTKMERAEIARRVARGEKITF